MALIEFKNVSFTYEGSNENALRRVSLKINEGEFIGVVGGTGEGKTTLVRCFNGLIPNLIKGRFQGKVIVDGLETHKTPVSQIANKVGFVFQDPDEQIFALEVRDEVAFGPKNLELPEEEVNKRVEAAAKLVGIQHLLDKETNDLSKGQRQLVCIASVLALDPKILVLDEPTASLDFKSTCRIYDVLTKLNEMGKTIITVEHKTNFLARSADRVLLVKEGRVIRDSSPEKLFPEVDFLLEMGVEAPFFFLISHELKKKGEKTSFSRVKDLLTIWGRKND